MTRRAWLLLAIGIAAACAPSGDPAAVTAIIEESCGPLDGAALDLTIPDRSDAIEIRQAPTWFAGDDTYPVAIPPDAAGVLVRYCPAAGQTCETASRGTLDLRAVGDDRYEGRLVAHFPGAGSRDIAFAGRSAPMPEGTACG